jgi:hypothetical protein
LRDPDRDAKCNEASHLQSAKSKLMVATNLKKDSRAYASAFSAAGESAFGGGG